ncbi:MAG TPA: four helix bundle protein [Phycisphaerae bacterium]|nr:four helix bundle protein [Phycisphaerae bacterium]
MLPSELSDRLLDFAARIGRVVDVLPTTPLSERIARGVVESGTAAGLNYEEATSTRRRVEFTGQLSDTLKELRKTGYWLRLIVKSSLLPAEEVREMIEECQQLCDIMEQSISTDRSRTWRFGQFGHWQASDLQFTIYGFPFMTIAMGTRRPQQDAKPAPGGP